MAQWNADDFRKQYKAIAESYAPADITTDDDEMRQLKQIVARLTPTQRTLLIAYAEADSYRKVGALLGFSHATIRNELNKIRAIIKDELANYSRRAAARSGHSVNMGRCRL